MIRILALLEAVTVTGPAKNLFRFVETARELEPGAIELSLAVFRRPPVEDDPLMQAASEAGIETDIVPERGRLDSNRVIELRVLAGIRKPDIIQTHSVKSHFLVRQSELWKKTPWIAFHHGYTATDFKMRLYNQLDRWSLRAARRVVTVSQAFAGELAARGVPPHRIAVIHNSSDPRLAGILRGEPGAERVVLAVGRLSREKAMADLVAALALLKNPPRLVIAGDGPERCRIEAAAAAAHLTLEMAGQVADMAPLYARADLVAIPSLSEGSPNVLLEALSAGVPVVATNVGGIPEMVQEGKSALLVPPSQPGLMAAAIQRVLNDRELASALSANGRQTVLTRFAPEKRARRLLEIYRVVTS